MNKFFQRGFLGLGVAFLMASSANANTLSYVLTTNQILSGLGYSATFAGFCGGTAVVNGGFPNCGLYGVGLSAANVTVSGATATSVTTVAPTLGTTDGWVSATLTGTTTVGVEANDTSGSTIAFIAAQGGGAATGLAAGVATSKTYTPDTTPGTNALLAATAGSAGVSTAGVMSATTSFTFQVTYSTTVLATTTANLNLDVLAMVINPTTGVQGTKSLKGTFLVSNVTAQTATPEPSSILMALGALSAVGIRRYRKSRA